MRKNPQSTDGFTIPRRPAAQGNITRRPLQSTPIAPAASQRPSETLPLPEAKNTPKMSKKELDESLRAIDDDAKPKKRRFIPNKKVIKRLLIGIIIILILVGGYLGVKAFLAGSQIFKGNVFDLLGESQPLKTDENGRSNILVFGTSEDDKAHEDAGPNLTDSIMMISVDQKKHNALITSVPRDLWVKYNQACISGYEGKVNVVYQCGSDDGKNPEAGAKDLMKTVGDIYGLKMHYFVKVNYTALKDAVDAVGGIDITIESDDPRGIYDPNFDWECNYTCTLVKYPNGPAHLKGRAALLLARARNSAGGYGLAGGNFDRERNQQKILIALRNKAASAGTLANPAAVSKLIDSLGNNVRTNFTTKEVKTLVEIGQKTDSKNIKTLRLDDPEEPLVTTGNVSGQSVVRPVLGIYDFSGIHAYVQKMISSDAVITEASTFTILNGSGVAGAAQVEADKLTAKGYTVSGVDNAPEGTYQPIEVYMVNKEKTGSKQVLARHYGVTVKTGLPEGVTADTDFVIIVGKTTE